MLSICCCTFNSKWDTESFIRLLNLHNKDFEFEIIITHDDRLDDGSKLLFDQLEQEFSNVKFITHSKEDTFNYFSNCLDHYDNKNIWPKDFRIKFRENLVAYKEGSLVKDDEGFLWQSSGILYNKAIEASIGDVILVTPGDFIYLFSLKQIYEYVKSNSKNDIFYGSPNALFAKISNLPIDFLNQELENVHSGKKHLKNYRWNSEECIRDYAEYESDCSNLYLPDFYNKKLYSLKNENFLNDIKNYCSDTVKNNGVQFIPDFHGFHIMTKKTYNMIGGFSEEYCHRAFADDKMTYLGNKTGRRSIPSQFTVAWVGQYELNGNFMHLESYWNKIKEKDLWWNKHPIPPRYGRRYLHNNVFADHEVGNLLAKYFSRDTKPIRLH